MREVGTVPLAKNPYALVRGYWWTGSTRRIPQKVHSLMHRVAVTVRQAASPGGHRFLPGHLGSLNLRESRVRENCMHGLSGGRWPAPGGLDAPPPTRDRGGGVISAEGREQVTRIRINRVNGQPEELEGLDGRRQPSGGGTSRVSREAQARICEGLGVKSPGPTWRWETGRRSASVLAPILDSTQVPSRPPESGGWRSL